MKFTDWSEEITKNLKYAQERYWKSIAEQNTDYNNVSDTPNRTEGLEQLWSLLSPQMPKQANEVMQQVFDLSKSHDPLSNHFSALKDVVDALAESQLHSFGIPSKKVQEELLEQVEQLTLENETLRARISVLEAEATKHNQAADKKAFNATAKRVSKPAGVTKISKPTGTTKPIPSVSGITGTKAVETTSPTMQQPPTNKHTARQSTPDDLSKIKGIGPKIESKLIATGIQTYEQLAELTTDQAQQLDHQLNLQGRLLRDNWKDQAAKLASTSDKT